MQKMNIDLVFGGLSGFLALFFGAYVTHILKATLSAHDADSIATALNYQLVHAGMIVIFGIIRFLDLPRRLAGLLKFSSILFMAGTVLFCGGIYLGVILNKGWFFHLAPAGGFAFMLGWLILAYTGFRLPSSSSKD